MKSKVISIVGLTASGKSAIGVEIARAFGGEIISADSRQVYRGLDIGTAKVTVAEMRGVPHHIIDVVDAGEHFDVYAFQGLAYAAIDDILSRGKTPIIVGGTGLYSRAIVENYDFARSQHTPAPFEVLQICLMPPKEWIRPRVERRIDERLRAGMIEETRALLARGVDRDWLWRLGLEYKFNIEYIEGRITMDEYRARLATATMQFAKRQRTWFKREKSTRFLDNPDTFLSATRELVADFIQ